MALGIMDYSMIIIILAFLVTIAVLLVRLLIAMIRALTKYANSSGVRMQQVQTRKSLGEVLKQHRMDCNMTQEFVAEAIGVSRQAVSKWENGTSDPSTSNLIALAKLFNIAADELIKEVQAFG